MEERARWLAERRYAELAQELGAPEPDEALEIVRARAELAARGFAPIGDLMIAAERLAGEGDREAPRTWARAVRALASVGARATASRWCDAAARRWPDDPDVALARDQLAADLPAGDDRAEWEIRALVARGEIAEARARIGDGSPLWQLAADLARGEADFGAAASAFERAIESAPSASDAPSLRAAAALARWAAGEHAIAIESLRALREETRGQPGDAAHAHACATDVLASLDRDPDARDAGPRWTWLAGGPPSWPRPTTRSGDAGTGALAIVCELQGLAPPSRSERPSIAYLRHALAAEGVVCVRAIASADAIAAALSEGAAIVLEEERPSASAFPIVLGFDPVADLLLLAEADRPGAYLATFADHQDRAALFGGAALFVCGAGDDGRRRRDALSARGVVHDERLDAVDRCDLDEQGRPPPRARVEVLAKEAAERAPELPMPQRRQGESLLAQLEAARLEDGVIERWLLVTRERFPEAEWALQIHARALEHRGRWHEAGIAWSDAAALDPWDERNTFGMARAYERIGSIDEAERALRRTCTLRPGHAQAMASAARIRVERGDLATARALSEVAEELAPDDASVLSVRATVLEREDRFDEALARLESIARERPRDVFVRARILRRNAYEGRWSDADRVAEEARAIDPGDPYCCADTVWVAFAASDRERAVSRLFDAASRCGPHALLGDEAARVIGTLLDERARAEVIDELVPRFASAPRILMDLANELVRRHLDDDAIALARRARALMDGDANGPWRLAQTLLSIPEARAALMEETIAALRDTMELAPGYPHPRVVLGLLRIADDPEEALALAHDADVHPGPGLVWTLFARAHAATGRAEEAARALERRAQLDADARIGAGTFLRNVGFFELAGELFEEVLRDHPDHAEALHERARAHQRAGDLEGAWAALDALPESSIDPFLGSVIAERLRRWDDVVRLAGGEAESIRRRSGGAGTYDGWPIRSRVAAARMALGDEASLDAVRDALSGHPDAFATVVSVERAIDHRRAEADAQALADRAPGAMWTLTRGGARW